MAYARSYRTFRKGRRGRRRPSWYNRKYSALQLASKAWRATRYIKGLVNSEMFHKDTSFSNTIISSSGYVQPLCSIAQGDTTGARTGNSILVRNLLLRIRWSKDGAASTTVGRFILFQDKQQVGDTTPAVTDILEAADVDSPLNLSSSGRFKVLMNKTINLTTYNPIYHKETYRKLYTHVRYNGTGATDYQKGGLYLLFISDQPTNTPAVDLYARLGYHDN